MKILRFVPAVLVCSTVFAADIRDENYGARLPSGGDAALWCCESGWKVGREKAVPASSTDAVAISCAKNEREAAQFVVTPSQPLRGFTASAGDLKSENGAVIPAAQIEILRVGYVNVAKATDKFGATGLWPDPLPPMNDPLDLDAKVNQPFWVRVAVPADAKAGKYSGMIALAAGAWHAEIPLRLEVFNFALPDRMTCETAFGFEANEAFRYHGAKTEQQKRRVLEMYWRTFAAHHISPYDFTPLDPIRVSWTAARPPRLPWADWHGGRVVSNEVHGGNGALAIFDDRHDAVVGATYEKLIPIPPDGIHVRFAFRTAMPGHTFLVSLNHYDADGKWISGHNYDMRVTGDGHWEMFDREISSFPPTARSLKFSIYGTDWTDAGEFTGLVWIDDIEILDKKSGAALAKGGDFEAPAARGLVAPPDKLQPKLDFTAWDREMSRVLETYHFNSFRLHVEGMGGGTYEGASVPKICEFTEGMPEYEIIFGSYVKQLEAHLREKGWLDLAYVYWFDEPDEAQYDYVRRGFEKLRRLAPGLRGMITEQVEPKLAGGPQLWCPVSSMYNHDRADERRKMGEHFWWYICCGPKGPYATEFIDHPGTSLRAWLWQTWQRKIEGVLVWSANYWTSPAAYPDYSQPQNPYEDPMSWVSNTKRGAKNPWGNGDGRFIYPPPAGANGNPLAPVVGGPVDSIRWEMLRDGIEDYEYLATLRRLLAANGQKLDAAKRAEFEKLLEVPPEISADAKQYTKTPAPIESRRIAIARAIEQLSP